MPIKITRQAYAEMFGPTVGDRIRLADTTLIVHVEKDFTVYGEEVKFGGGIEAGAIGLKAHHPHFSHGRGRRRTRSRHHQNRVARECTAEFDQSHSSVHHQYG